MQRLTIGRRPDDGDLRRIAALLDGDAVILLPTDTIYGLHGRARSAAAMERLATLKGRDGAKPFVVVASDLPQLEEIGAEIPAAFREALESIWPAPLTAIVPLRAPIAASRGERSLAVRIPALDWLRDLLSLTGPLASTSANRSGEPPVSIPESLARDLQNSLDAIVDAGPLFGEPSVIVEVTGEVPRLIREGEHFFTQEVWKRLRKSL